MRHWLQYVLVRAVATGITSMDVQTNLRIAGAIGRGIYRLDRRHRESVLGHLQLAFPEWSDAQRQATASKAFEHLLQLAVELCHVPRLIHSDSWSSRLRLGESLGPVLKLCNAGQPVILLTGHLGNWEVLGHLTTALGYRLDAVARPLDNPLINQWLIDVRERQGMRIISKWNATDNLISVLRSGGALGFIADQNAGDKGQFVPFFGKLASTYKSIGLLAIDQNVPVACAYALRIGDRYEYELGVEDVIYPQDWASQPDPLFYVTARYMKAIEQMIRRSPHQYLWIHRRWKSRPRFERENKPMSESLRQKLQLLPWMDESTLRRLTRPAETSSVLS